MPFGSPVQRTCLAVRPQRSLAEITNAPTKDRRGKKKEFHGGESNPGFDGDNVVY